MKECKASEFADCDIVFSGLDSDVAGEIGRFPRNPRSPPAHPQSSIARERCRMARS